MKIELVIGANYGDEGKGLMTEYLCSKSNNPLVIMANGGSQRGHTVDDPKYGRYVFHHFGSGTFRNAVTYFPSKFIINPMQFVKEYNELTKIMDNKSPTCFMSKNCKFQLPGDIALNWHIEKCRGEARHGSVGCGIWETITRYRTDTACLTLSQFCNLSHNKKKQYIIESAYKASKFRLEEENIKIQPGIYDLFLSDSFLDHFIEDCTCMNLICKSIDFNEDNKPLFQLSKFDTIVLECGQGLLLDEYYYSFREHDTTPSMTSALGQVSIVNWINQRLQKEKCSNNIESINVNYVTRTYITKHGPGKFSDNIANNTFIDKTNKWNEWQGDLRYSEIYNYNVELRCLTDFENFKKFIDKNIHTLINKKMFYTHLDEITLPKDAKPDFICDNGKADSIIESVSK